MMSHPKAFTLLELLIVIAIVAVVGAMSAVAVNAARSKQRDAVRIANVRQIQSALEDFYNERNAYPELEGPIGDPTSACLSVNGFQSKCQDESSVFLRVVPATIERGLEGNVVCGAPAHQAFCYARAVDGAAYRIQFELENGLSNVGLQKGVNCATAEGMKAGVCFF